MTMTADESQPFASLDALQHASDRLIESLPSDELPASDSEGEAIFQRVTQFIHQATATGAVLDAPDERRTAQALVDFWVAKSYAIPHESRVKPRGSTKADTLLRPFDLATVMTTIAEGDKVMASLGERDDENKSRLRQILLRVAPSLGDKATSYQNLARRILLRTIRMPDGDRTCEPVAVTRKDLVSLGDPERTNEVLDALIASGVLRAEPRASGELISLRHEALTREWDTLRALIDKRVGFRDAVIFWGQRARTKGALISAGLADKALADYADLNALERAFIAASSSYSRRRMIVASVVCAVALGVSGYVSKYYNDRWVAAQQEAEAANAVLVAISTTDVRSKEESIRKLAFFRKPLNLQAQTLEGLDLNGIYTGASSPAIAEFFKSAILGVNLGGANLRYASFSQSKIQEVIFTGAELSSARFDEAVITKANFSGATLYRAIFDHAQFNDVNFSNADLRSASFRKVGIKDNKVDFTGAAWWLALGWALPQVDQLVEDYKGFKVKEAKVFKDDVERAKQKVAEAVAPEDEVAALNEVAWTYAIYGADLTTAKEYVHKAVDKANKMQKASNENKTIKGKAETWLEDNSTNFADTMAYILLQEGQPAEAVKLLEEQPSVVKLLEQTSAVEANSHGDLMFRYAIALHALALKKQGDEKVEQKAQDYLTRSLRERYYVPSHELYLLRRYITGEFKDKLAALLSTEAN
jgi:uncharacterized protein YjbI with pentapeptide repeats